MQPRNVRQIQAHKSAFAAVLADGSVVSWGACGSHDPGHSGGYGAVDFKSVEGRLKDVQQIQASSGAFAAILSDGSVVTWGSAACALGSK